MTAEPVITEPRLVAPYAVSRVARALDRASHSIDAAADTGASSEMVISCHLAVAAGWLELAKALAERQAMNPLPPDDEDDRTRW